MWLKTPEKIDKFLWDAPLEPASKEVVNRVAREWVARGISHKREEIVDNLPMVSIGEPETWELTELYSPGGVPLALKSKLDESDFYLLRFACSFRSDPEHREIKIQWARFTIKIHPNDMGQQPIAFDLHPLMFNQEVKRNIKVTLGPLLKFQEIEGSLGGIDFGLEYAELQPIISACGIGESQPSWDYEAAKGIKIQGSKFMHLLLKVPKYMRPVEATLDLVADVEIRGSLLQTVLGGLTVSEGDQLNVKIVR